MSHRSDPQGETVVEASTRTRTQVARPPLFRVLLHNDDYTTMEFVVDILVATFHKSHAEATAIMLLVHQTGVGVAGVFSREIAEAKVQEVTAAAEAADYPLLCTMEPDDADADDGADPGNTSGTSAP